MGNRSKVSFDHKLIGELLEAIMPQYDRAFEIIKHNDSRRDPDYEKYIRDCVNSLNRIRKLYRQFFESLGFIRSYYMPEDENQMSHREYLDYHFTMLYTTYVSFFDCSLQCINRLLYLGIDHRSINTKVLLNHRDVKRHNLSSNIKKLIKYKEKHSKCRNNIIHLGRSKNLGNVETFLFLSTYSKKFKESDQIALKEHFKAIMDKEILQLSIDFNLMAGEMSDLLTSLEKPFHEISKTLRR